MRAPASCELMALWVRGHLLQNLESLVQTLSPKAFNAAQHLATEWQSEDAGTVWLVGLLPICHRTPRFVFVYAYERLGIRTCPQKIRILLITRRCLTDMCSLKEE